MRERVCVKGDTNISSSEYYGNSKWATVTPAIVFVEREREQFREARKPRGCFGKVIPQ